MGLIATFDGTAHIGALADVEDFMAKGTFAYEFVIEDYPIGVTARGKCRLGIEAKPSKGVRTTKTTTDKNGRWCSPKVSTYEDRQDTGLLVLCERPHHRAGWLFLSARNGVWVAFANGESLVVCKPPFSTPPIRTGIVYAMGGGSRMTIPASPREEVEAWDEWVAGLNKLGARAALAIKHYGGAFAAVV